MSRSLRLCDTEYMTSASRRPKIWARYLLPACFRYFTDIFACWQIELLVFFSTATCCWSLLIYLPLFCGACSAPSMTALPCRIQDDFTPNLALRQYLRDKLKCRKTANIPAEAITVVRKSFDARKKQLNWVYCVDVDTDALVEAGVRNTQRHPCLRPRCSPSPVRPLPHREVECNNNSVSPDADKCFVQD